MSPASSYCLQDTLTQLIRVIDPAMPFLCIRKVCFRGGAAWQCCLERSLQNPSIDSISLGHFFLLQGSLPASLVANCRWMYLSPPVHIAISFANFEWTNRYFKMLFVLEKDFLSFQLMLERKIKSTVTYICIYSMHNMHTCVHTCWKIEVFFSAFLKLSFYIYILKSYKDHCKNRKRLNLIAETSEL